MCILRMRVIPLLAVVSLIIGIFPLGSQTMLEFGQATALNILFFLSTLLFAAFSLLSLFTTYLSLSKPVSVTARIYATLLSLSCFGFTLYLAYWKIIGLRLWHSEFVLVKN